MAQNNVSVGRKKKSPSYRSFRLSSRLKSSDIKQIPKVTALWRETWSFLWKHKRPMATFALIYGLTYFMFVRGISGFSMDIGAVKDELRDALTGNIGAVVAFISIYFSLVSSMTITADDAGNFYQVSILVIFSLAFIWLLRRLHDKRAQASVRDAFYLGMGPLVPFLGVVLMLLLMTLPAALGATLLVSAASSAAIRSDVEFIGFGVLMVLMTVLSLYLLAGSLFSVYIVTLKGTRPLVAVRSSMRLLSIHRWRVAHKIVGFMILLLLLGFVLVLPFIVWLPRYAEVAFFVMSTASFAVFHTFMYKLYRSLL